MNDYQLLTLLRSLLGALEMESASSLYRDTIAICNYLEKPVYRLAVFAPFNHGKSTLLNALLGSKTLPIDLIPSTGAGIIVGYGEELTTEITFHDGQKTSQLGVGILQEYAVLNEDRRLNRAVQSVKVFSPHPWLRTGVELLDLPGTNDREAQNDLVKDRLLSADLVIHVLDARKLMTLEEREHLTQWLQGRGITRVIFVVNFLNLLTPEEQHSVRQRIYYIAESFRSDLPPGISNVYCVDALPALRARLKGDLAAAQTTGIGSLESALQNIASQADNSHQLPRVYKVAQLLLDRADIKQQQLQQAIGDRTSASQQQLEVKQKAQKLIQQGFDRSISDFRGWLYLPTLLSNHRANLAIALQQMRFDSWLRGFQSQANDRIQVVNKWVVRGDEFFARVNPQLLTIDFPSPPTIEIAASTPDTRSAKSTSNVRVPSELSSVLQGKVGTTILGGASYILNKVAPKSTTSSVHNSSTKISSQAYADAAENYLKEFGDRANAQLTKYEQLAQQYITFRSKPDLSQSTAEDYQLQLLNNLVTNLNNHLEQIVNPNST